MSVGFLLLKVNKKWFIFTQLFFFFLFQRLVLVIVLTTLSQINIFHTLFLRWSITNTHWYFFFFFYWTSILSHFFHQHKSYLFYIYTQTHYILYESVILISLLIRLTHFFFNYPVNFFSSKWKFSNSDSFLFKKSTLQEGLCINQTCLLISNHLSLCLQIESLS